IGRAWCRARVLISVGTASFNINSVEAKFDVPGDLLVLVFSLSSESLMCPSWINSSNILFFSSRRRHTIFKCDLSSDVCSSDLRAVARSDRGGVDRNPDGSDLGHRQ